MEKLINFLEREPTFVKAGYYLKVNVLQGSASQLDSLPTRIQLLSEEIKALAGGPRRRMVYASYQIARHAIFHHAVGTKDIQSLTDESDRDKLAFTFGTIIAVHNKIQRSRKEQRLKTQSYDLGLTLSDFLQADSVLGAQMLLAAHDADLSKAIAQESYFVNLAGMELQPVAMGVFGLLPSKDRLAIVEAMAEVDPTAGSMFIRDVSGNFGEGSNKDVVGYITKNWDAAHGAIKEIYGKDVTVVDKLTEVKNEFSLWTDILPSDRR